MSFPVSSLHSPHKLSLIKKSSTKRNRRHRITPPQANNKVASSMHYAQAPNQVLTSALRGRCRFPYPPSPRRTSFHRLRNQAQNKTDTTAYPLASTFFFSIGTKPPGCGKQPFRAPLGAEKDAWLRPGVRKGHLGAPSSAGRAPPSHLEVRQGCLGAHPFFRRQHFEATKLKFDQF